MVDLRAAFLDESIDGFKAVRRLERTAQHAVHAETMQCERLLDSFLQAPSCGLVPLLQFIVQLIEGREGLFIFRPVVGRLQPLAATTPARPWTDSSRRFHVCATGTLYQDPLRNAFFTAAFRLLPPSMITSRPWELSSPRASSERRTASTPSRSPCPSPRSPKSVFSRKV